MKVFVLIQQKPLKVKAYTSLTALYEANRDILEVSKSKLDKYPFDRFDYINQKIVISKTTTLTSGDVRNMQKEQ
jgi:hypothetical protein